MLFPAPSSSVRIERPNDKWLRFVFIPSIAWVINAVFNSKATVTWSQSAFWFVMNIAYGLLMWEVAIQWVLFVRRRYTDIEQTRRRVLITFVGYLGIIVVLQTLVMQLAVATGTNRIPITPDVYLKMISIGFVSLLLIGAVLESMYYLRKYKEAIQDSEAVKKAGLQSQYDSLKNQVNPHFLFNALNSLSVLISEDRVRAGLFLDELSSVYRYILQAGQRPVVALEEELAFLRAYRFLLDVRFGDALRWDIRVAEPLPERWLPPLTFQTLVENALRHNILLPEQPLTLHITAQPDGTLEVCNSLQRRRVTPTFAPQGSLTLLIMQFESLGLPVPTIVDDGQRFRVRLPLAGSAQVADLLTDVALPVR